MKSYLGWPVKLRDPYDHVEAHVTLKYLGAEPFTVEDLEQRLAHVDTNLIIAGRPWHGEVFGEAHVMVLSGVERMLRAARFAVEDLRFDDHPQWRPHITLPTPLWAIVTQNRLDIEDVVDTVGHLTLFTNGEVVHIFQPTEERDPVLWRRRYSPV